MSPFRCLFVALFVAPFRCCPLFVAQQSCSGLYNSRRITQACFAGDMLLDAEEGKKRADAIQVGDKLWSRSEFDPASALALKEVEEVFVRVAPILNLHIAGQIIRTAPEHPFYVEGRGWIPAAMLTIGDVLLTRDDRLVPVEGIADSGRVETVYNWRIAEYHTYFVSATACAPSVWAHNACNVDSVAARHRGRRIGDDQYQFPNRASAVRAASEISGNLGARTRAIRLSDPNYRGVPARLRRSDRVIGRESMDGSRGWRNDMFGHRFDGRPHFNAWGPGFNIHLYY
jgi:Pretoxin HINT domain